MISEFDLIDRYFKRAPISGVLGIGDDCALFSVPPGMQLATSTDLLIQGRHFFSDVDPRSLGHKALAVNLSDLAAMGAQPIACLLGLGLPHIDERWLSAFADGFHNLAQIHACPLIGGDTTRSEQTLTISVTVFGAVRAQHALRRSTARVGDEIWISGELGAADLAYQLLSGHYAADPARLAARRAALEWPQPRIALGLALAGLAHAAIDLSDGLLQDLGHLLNASGCGACLYYEALPVAASLLGLPEAQRRHAVLGGGDVYELCFTAAAHDHAQIRAAAVVSGVTVTPIGHVVTDLGLRVLDAQSMPMRNLPRGFEHFSRP